MPLEIERKFLVTSDAWRCNAEGKEYSQGYLSANIHATVRVRIEGEKGFITVKGPIKGLCRSEFEYSVPLNEAIEMQQLCETPLVTKTRYRIPHDGHIWEVDEFHGENEGLIIAEIELSDEKEIISLPEWLGEEVSSDRRYCNSRLAVTPFKNW